MADQTTSLRRCIGSARFGIGPHEAPVEDFPRQPSQKDGFGRMCTTHWNGYTAGLARDAKARKAAESAEPTEAAGPAPETTDPTESTEAQPPAPAPKRARRAGADEDAGQ